MMILGVTLLSGLAQAVTLLSFIAKLPEWNVGHKSKILAETQAESSSVNAQTFPWMLSRRAASILSVSIRYSLRCAILCYEISVSDSFFKYPHIKHKLASKCHFCYFHSSLELMLIYCGCILIIAKQATLHTSPGHKVLSLSENVPNKLYCGS